MIYIDLDNTLIDSVKRLSGEMTAALKYGISNDNFSKAMLAAFQNDGVSRFGHKVLFKACCNLCPGLSKKLLNDWNDILNTPHIFPDAINFLSSFPKKDLVLLTTGSKEFQLTKIRVHGLKKFFSDIKIVPSPKCTSISPPPNSIFIDDSPREIDATKQTFPGIYCILVRKPAPWEKQKTSHFKDAQCADLVKAIELIKQMPHR